jgi:hypothetical protein
MQFAFRLGRQPRSAHRVLDSRHIESRKSLNIGSTGHSDQDSLHADADCGPDRGVRRHASATRLQSGRREREPSRRSLTPQTGAQESARFHGRRRACPFGLPGIRYLAIQNGTMQSLFDLTVSYRRKFEPEHDRTGQRPATQCLDSLMPLLTCHSRFSRALGEPGGTSPAAAQLPCVGGAARPAPLSAVPSCRPALGGSPPPLLVGSGISGWLRAHRLAGEAQVTLFEAGDYFGGHTHTVDVTLDGVTHGVDTGFLVFNDRTYPNWCGCSRSWAWPPRRRTCRSRCRCRPAGLEWSGSTSTPCSRSAQPAAAALLAHAGRHPALQPPGHGAGRTRRRGERAGEPIGDFLDRHRFGDGFRDWYFLPMIGCIWSCPTDQMLRFPVATMIRFCHNHGLIQVTTGRSGTRCAAARGTTCDKMLRASPTRAA